MYRVLIRLLISFFLLSTLIPSTLSAAEVDHFSQLPAVDMADSRSPLNDEVAQRIDRALKRANRNAPHLKPRKVQRVPKQSRCDVDRLYDSFRVLLARPIVGQVESFAEQHPDLDRIRMTLPDSIYRDFTWPHSPTLVLSERVASVVRVGEHFVGTDKFGHFFTEGFSYFRETERMTLPLKHAFLFGEWTESVYFGAETTGVYSFADLVANFNGLRFWNRILSEHPDPLSQRALPPYVACEDEKWVVAAKFDWREYIDPAWNESVNCSMMRTLGLLEKVLNTGPVCNPTLLPWRRYGELAPVLFNQHGLAVLPDYLQPEVILTQRHPELMTESRISWIKGVREWLEKWRIRQDVKREQRVVAGDRQGVAP